MKRVNPWEGGQHPVRRDSRRLRVLQMGFLGVGLRRGGGMGKILGWRGRMGWWYEDRDLGGVGVSGHRGSV
jgi:hypothetical protein